VLKVGRFPVTWELTSGRGCPIDIANPAVNEIHVHLLAKCEADAEAIVSDLRTALEQEDDDSAGVRPLGLAA
jgi:hypothetical protein